jgi:hypothetical protein
MTRDTLDEVRKQYVDVATFAAFLDLTKDAIRKLIDQRRIFALKVAGRYRIAVELSCRLMAENMRWHDAHPDSQEKKDKHERAS